MERIDVLQLVRENRDKYKQHLQKMKELEERDQQLNYRNIYKEYNNTYVPSTKIPEKASETLTLKKNDDFRENEKVHLKIKHDQMSRESKIPDRMENYIYDKLYDSNDEDALEQDLDLNENYYINRRHSDSDEMQDDHKQKINSENDEDVKKEIKDENKENKRDVYNSYKSELSDKNPENTNDKNENSNENNRSISFDEMDNKYDRREENIEIGENEEEQNHKSSDYNYKLKNIYENYNSSEEEHEIPKIKNKEKYIVNRGYLKLPKPQFLQTNTKGVNLTRSNHSMRKNNNEYNSNLNQKKATNANESVNTISEKRPYTALTYSTIKKIKNSTNTSIKSIYILNLTTM